MNISRHYVSRALGGTGRFRDTHLRVRGTAVSDLLGVLQHTMNDACAYRVTTNKTAAVPAASTSSASITTRSAAPTSVVAALAPPNAEQRRQTQQRSPPSTNNGDDASSPVSDNASSQTPFPEQPRTYFGGKRSQLLLSTLSAQRSPLDKVKEALLNVVDKDRKLGVDDELGDDEHDDPDEVEAGQTPRSSDETVTTSDGPGVRVQVLEQNSLRNKRHIQHAMRLAFRNASSYVPASLFPSF